MKKIVLLILLNSFLLSDIFNVPTEEYPTIQSGIDVAQDGDTVLVAQGIYYENLIINRSITLASHAIYDNLSSWNTFNDFSSQWEVTNDNINSTIIDGGTATGDYGSTIIIYAEEDTCITPEIIGLTIQHGNGTEVCRYVDDCTAFPEFLHILGGGILFDISNPKVHYNKFINNGSNNTREGGAMYGTAHSDEDWSFDNVPTNYFDLNNSAMRCEIDEFNLSDNFYHGNYAQYGNSFANQGFENTNTGGLGDIHGEGNTFDMSGSIFDIANCSFEEISPVWVYVKTQSTLNLNEIESDLCAFSGTDVYVDSNIEQECIDDGCGTFNNPFKTITWALQMILPSEDNHVTIYISEGTYSTETGEVFPIVIPSYVSIVGESEAATIIDAQQTGGITVYAAIDVNISNLTILRGGFRLTGSNVNMSHCTVTGYSDTGIVIKNSLPNNGYYSSEIYNVNLSYITIEENIGVSEYPYVGGIHIDSHPIEWYEDEELYFIVPEQPFIYYNYLNHVIIKNNTGGDVGGIWLEGYAYLNHVLISNNKSDEVAGMKLGKVTGFDSYLFSGFHHLLKNVTIANNYTLDYQEGVGLSTSYYGPVIINSSIYNNEISGYFCDDCSDCSTCAPPEDDSFEKRTFPTIEYSLIDGGWIGEGNISVDFAYAGCSEDYYLSESSPAIDSGVFYYEYNGEMLFNLDESEYYGDAPDMGFYEYEGMDLTGNGGVGDINADGNINVVDLVNLIFHLLGFMILSEDSQCNAHSLNPDGILNVLDVIALINIILDI